MQTNHLSCKDSQDLAWTPILRTNSSFGCNNFAMTKDQSLFVSKYDVVSLICWTYEVSLGCLDSKSQYISFDT